ncbi:hypothetical protein BB560_001711 [Smittium megazygosporum]|uniref:TLC domain-containing protein n=1 Tax=Smittium megazygosporum TaxID=133381 RepID=A0A2T9ZGU2_9FUNG|nr:hypothetical protein BB560_005959 [Smittium megazygosporum]PVV03799.1 hypothetical protein BB560_001711 [Smittium megazygosporum]
MQELTKILHLFNTDIISTVAAIFTPSFPGTQRNELLSKGMDNIINAAVLFQLIYVFSPHLLRILRPEYDTLSYSKRYGLKTTIVSQVHSLVALWISFPLFFDKALIDDHVLGVSKNAMIVCGFSTGYFLWDAIICIANVSSGGIADVFHGVCCFITFSSIYNPALQHRIPLWIIIFYFTNNIILNILNVFWFRKILHVARKQLLKPKPQTKEEDSLKSKLQ